MQQRNKRRVHSAAPNLKYQSARAEKQGGRLAGAFVLCLLLPPVGVAWAWREKLNSILPRILLTVVGIASMTLIMTLILSKPGEVDEILPSPVVPLPFNYVAEPAAPAPGTEEQVSQPEITQDAPQEQVVPEGAAPAPAAGEEPVGAGDGDVTTEPEAVEEVIPEAEPTPEPIMVYCVSENATLYHAADTCDGQENRQAIALTDAQNAGLIPCEKCNPPGI